MGRAVKVVISLPEELLAAAERERAASGESRSELFRRALEHLIHRARERDAVERYLAGYRPIPEDPDDLAAADALTVESISSEPWDETEA